MEEKEWAGEDDDPGDAASYREIRPGRRRKNRPEEQGYGSWPHDPVGEPPLVVIDERCRNEECNGDPADERNSITSRRHDGNDANRDCGNPWGERGCLPRSEQ